MLAMKEPRAAVPHEARPLSILTATTLFPNAVQGSHGIFVETRLRHLVASGEAAARVLAPVPWLPPFLRYPAVGPLRRIPHRERRGDLLIEHPRYLVLPKIGMNLTPYTLYRAMRASLHRMLAEGLMFDLIDAHYFYPDGVAAVWAAKELGIPVVVTARGTDINLIPDYARPRRLIQRAAAEADALITVCEALKESLIALGVPGKKITVLRNGVDLTLFRPIERVATRAKLGLTRRTLGSVGHLVERKGHHHVIGALALLPDTDLVVAGSGPDRARLEALAARLGVSSRVRFLGALDQERLREVYNAIDVLVLASSREGWANVLLESMACGTPVVASSVWGTPEVVRSPEAGILMTTLDAKGVAEGVNALFGALPMRAATRRYAEQFDWDATTQGQLALFRRLLSERSGRKDRERR
jgi:teichuronic acid biosynthesis glycosyltransferase TuaC